MNETKIEILGKPHFDAWLEMRTKLWPGFAKHRLEMQSSMEDENFVAFISLDFNDRPIGFLEASIRSYANGCKDRPVVFCEGVWVEEEQRNRKVGYELIARLERWAIEKGFKEICSDCEIENEISLSAHSKWGFQETERVVYFQKDIV